MLQQTISNSLSNEWQFSTKTNFTGEKTQLHAKKWKKRKGFERVSIVNCINKSNMHWVQGLLDRKFFWCHADIETYIKSGTIKPTKLQDLKTTLKLNLKCSQRTSLTAAFIKDAVEYILHSYRCHCTEDTFLGLVTSSEGFPLNAHSLLNPSVYNFVILPLLTGFTKPSPDLSSFNAAV